MDRIILHCDCNCFYASCELLSHPDLRQLPVAVCGDPTERHGIILAKMNRRSAAASKRRRPSGRPSRSVLASSCCRRTTASTPNTRKINAVYGEYTDLVEPFGIDESWLDVTNSLHLFGGDARALADTLRGRIKREFGLTISVGVSFNKVFAKLGSDYKNLTPRPSSHATTGATSSSPSPSAIFCSSAAAHRSCSAATACARSANSQNAARKCSKP